MKYFTNFLAEWHESALISSRTVGRSWFRGFLAQFGLGRLVMKKVAKMIDGWFPIGRITVLVIRPLMSKTGRV